MGKYCAMRRDTAPVTGSISGPLANIKTTTYMKKYLIFSLLILIWTNLSGQLDNPKARIVSENKFQKEIDPIGLVFEMPKEYHPTLVKENGDLYYSFAIINKDSTMEVRYSIFPIKDRLKEYEKSLKDPSITMIHPNKMYTGIIEANMLNMTAGKTYEIGPFPKTAVKKEFNADEGGSCFFEFNCEFGKGYKYGHFVFLHKDDVADVIITYLDNNKDIHNDLMFIPFHALKFK